MNDFIKTLTGILIPLVGTTIGAAMVFFMKNKMNPRIEKILLGFASGVMIAASVWSLLLPAIDMAQESGTPPWLPSLVGFLGGVAFLTFLDIILPNQSGAREKRDKTSMLILAVTIHNFPEGMAVGVVFAGMLAGNAGITFASALALSIGIAIQNLPEGAIISMPLSSTGVSRFRSFLYGFLSGVVEPIGAVIMILLTSYLSPLLPYILSFAAGAMIYVVAEELIPEAKQGEDTVLPTISCALGFSIMMLLDVALG